jgi:hypothetical protein
MGSYDKQGGDSFERFIGETSLIDPSPTEENAAEDRNG